MSHWRSLAFMDFSRALYGANSKIDLSVSKRSARRKTHPSFLSTREFLERFNSPFALQDEWRPVVRRFPTRIV